MRTTGCLDRRRFGCWIVRTIGVVAFLAICRVLSAAADDPPLKQTKVQGTVVDEAGTPVAGIEVTRHYRDLPTMTRTDAGGHFTLEVPTEARSTRALIARDEAGGRQGYFRFGDDPIAADAAPQIVLRKSRPVDVTVIGADQRPLAGVSVAVVSSYWPICESKTDERGKVAFQVPSDAPLDSVFAYQIDVGLDYLLYRKAGELANGPYRLPQDHAVPLTLTLSGTRTITVRVVDDAGQP